MFTNQSNTNHSKHDQPQHHSTKRNVFYAVTNESGERISARMRTNSRHIKQYVQATSKSVFIKHDDEERLNRLSIGRVEQIERRMLYIGMERTRIYHELRLRMDSPRTETASRWFIMRYLLTTVDGKQPSYVRFHAYTHIYTYTYTVYSFVCREYRSFACSLNGGLKLISF